MQIKHKAHYLIIITILIFTSLFFLFFSLNNLHLPGLNDEEAMIGTCAFPLLGLGNPGMFVTSKVAGLELAGLELPLMYHPYHSSSAAYLIFPFLYFGGISVETIRFSSIFYGFLTLFYFYLFIRSVSKDTYLPALSVLLLGTHPTFILGIRKGWWHSSSVLLLEFIGLFLIAQWLKKRKISLFYSGIFFLGLSVSIHTSQIFFIFTLSLIAIIACILHIFSIKGLSYHKLAAAFILFLLSNILLIAGNVLNNDYQTVKIFAAQFKKVNTIESNYAQKLGERIRNLSALINGSVYQKEEFQEASTVPVDAVDAIGLADLITRNSIYTFFFILSIIYFLYYLFRYKCADISILILTGIILYMLISPYTLSTISHNHIFPLFPFTILLITLLLRKAYDMRIIKYAVPAVFAFIIANNSLTMGQYHDFISKTGGTNTSSSAVYDLSEWLLENNITDSLTVDWGLHYNLTFLTQGRHKTRYYSRDLSDFGRILGKNSADTVLIDFLSSHDKKLICIIRSNSLNLVPVQRAVKSGDMIMTLIKQFYEYNGIPLYNIYSISKANEQSSYIQK